MRTATTANRVTLTFVFLAPAALAAAACDDPWVG
jgi:hypothetical protein